MQRLVQDHAEARERGQTTDLTQDLARAQANFQILHGAN